MVFIVGTYVRSLPPETGVCRCLPIIIYGKGGCCPGFAHGMRIIRRWRICCRSRAVLRVTAVGVVVSDIGHARLSVGAKPGRLQGVKPPAGIFGAVCFCYVFYCLHNNRSDMSGLLG